jgi:hypothetical protein
VLTIFPLLTLFAPFCGVIHPIAAILRHTKLVFPGRPSPFDDSDYHYSPKLSTFTSESIGSNSLCQISLLKNRQVPSQILQSQDTMPSNYYESSFSSRSSGERVYIDPRRGMSDHHSFSQVRGMVANSNSTERKEAPVRQPTKKREVEIHNHRKASDEPRRPAHTADDRWR